MDSPAAKIEAMDVFGRDFRERMTGVEVGPERIADHLEHLVRVAGEEAVAFGSDFDGVPDLPRGVSGCDAYPGIVDLLLRRGMGQATISKVCFENALRIFKE